MGSAPQPRQGRCPWTLRRVFDPLDTRFAIELRAFGLAERACEL